MLPTRPTNKRNAVPRKSSLLSSSALACVAMIQPAYAEDFVVNALTATTNNGFVVNGDDSLTVTAAGSINTVMADQDAVAATGANNLVNNLGSVSTNGQGARGIRMTGANATVQNSGIVDTGASSAIGISVAGDNATVQNSGIVETSENGSAGIFVWGESNSIVHSGYIETLGDNSSGIAIADGTTSIMMEENAGIRTFGDQSHGISIEYGSNNASIWLEDSAITLSGEGSTGIVGGGDGHTIESAGTFEVFGDDGRAIALEGDRITIALSDLSEIFTTGMNGTGVSVQGDDGLISNAGYIETTDDGASAILLEGIDGRIIHSGEIVTGGANSYGIAAIGAGNQVTTEGGRIVTDGFASFGILMAGNSARVTLGSEIETIGSASAGIEILGDVATVLVQETGEIVTAGSNSRGVGITGNSATVLNEGRISTLGTFASGVRVEGANASVLNAGEIETDGNDAHGIVTQSGAGTNIRHEGYIATSGVQSAGIYAAGEQATVNVLGEVETSGSAADAVRIGGDGSRVSIDGGMLATSGDDANGVTLLGENTDVAMDAGLILTSGNGSDGISATGTSGHVVRLGENGYLSTTGESSNAIFLSEDGNRVESHGSVSTTNLNSDGIVIGGSGEVINTGAIGTFGDISDGIVVGYNGGSGSYVLNDGTILIEGTQSVGVRVNGNDHEVLNRGAIEVLGIGASGIMINGGGATNARVVNAGTIDMATPTGFGIDVLADDAYVENSGTIQASGEGAIGGSGDGLRVRNAGEIFAVNEAVSFQGSDAFLRLDAGSTISGGLTFADVATATVDIGLHNADLTFTGVPDTIRTNGNPYLIDGDRILVFDRDGLTAQGDLDLSRARALDERVAAQRGRIYGNDNDPAVRTVWGDLGVISSSDVVEPNFTIGASIPVLDGDRLDLFASVGSVDDAVTAGTDIAADTVMLGAAWGRDMGELFYDVSLIAGSTQGTVTRNIANNLVINGYEQAIGSVDSQFASASLRVGMDKIWNGREITPSARLRYTFAHMDGYAETGSASPLTVEDRTTHALDVRAQVATSLAPMSVSAGDLDVSILGGIDANWRGGDAFEATVAGQQFSFDEDPASEFGAFVGAQAILKWQIGDFSIGGEVGHWSESGTSSRLSVGFTKKF